MTEEEARAWVSERHGVSRETQLRRFETLLREGAERQNLVSANTLECLWARHFVDSAQLLMHAPIAGTWMDIGTGAGLPGIVIALLHDQPVILVEPRGRRVEFLNACIHALDISGRVRVEHAKVEAVRCASAVSVISARAVAPLPVLFDGARHCADSSTVWVLPKGRSAQSEVAAVLPTWHGVFHVEPSITQPESGIVIAQGVSPR